MVTGQQSDPEQGRRGQNVLSRPATPSVTGQSAWGSQASRATGRAASSFPQVPEAFLMWGSRQRKQL